MIPSHPFPPFQAFMTGLIDYAGLFPPANLDLAEAAENYGRYLISSDKAMLARFIIPATKLADLPTLSAGWRFSILGRSGATANDFHQNTALDLAAIQTFRQNQPATADVFEVRLPTAVLSSSELPELLHQTGQHLTTESGLTLFYEVPLDENWQAPLSQVVTAVAQYNQQTGHHAGLKLRCGGVVATAFPTAEQIATALHLCRDHGVPLKATAGLHHPIRHYNDSVQTKMHGFINVFGAGLLAHIHQLSLADTIAILHEEDPHQFTFSETHFSWQTCTATADQIAQLRQTRLISYGSCSFDEPREDLRALGWL